MNTLLIASVFAGVSMPTTVQERRVDAFSTRASVRSIIAGYRPVPRMAAEKMIAKYGQPEEASDLHLIWRNNGPWKYTEVMNVEYPHDFPMPHKDCMRQVVNYRVPPSRLDELAAYDGSVIFDRTPGELSARCDKEEANFLAINLSHDVITGKRSVAGARSFYARTVKALMAMRPNMEQKRYSSGFIFPKKFNTGFRDKPAR